MQRFALQTFEQKIDIQKCMTKITYLLNDKIPKMIPTRLNKLRKAKQASLAALQEINTDSKQSKKIRKAKAEEHQRLLEEQKKQIKELSCPDYIAAMRKIYFLMQICTNELLVVFEENKLNDLTVLLRTIVQSYNLIYESFMDYTINLNEKVSLSKISTGKVGRSPAFSGDIEELRSRITNMSEFMRTTLKKKQGGDQALQELIKRFPGKRLTLEQHALLATKLDFSDEAEYKQRMIEKEKEKERRVNKLMDVIGSRGSSEYFYDEKDPDVIIEINKRVYSDLLMDSKMMIKSLREKIITLEKYESMKPQAGDEIERLVEDMLLSVAKLNIGSLKRIATKQIKGDFETAERLLLTAVDGKCKKLAHRIIKLIHAFKPEAREEGTMTKETNESINTFIMRKASKGDKYASKVIKTRIKNLELTIEALRDSLRQERLAHGEAMARISALEMQQKNNYLINKSLEEELLHFKTRSSDLVQEVEDLRIKKDDYARKTRKLRSRISDLQRAVYYGYMQFKKLVSNLLKDIGFSELPEISYDKFKLSLQVLANQFNNLTKEYKEVDSSLEFEDSNLEFQKKAAMYTREFSESMKQFDIEFANQERQVEKDELKRRVTAFERPGGGLYTRSQANSTLNSVKRGKSKNKDFFRRQASRTKFSGSRSPERSKTLKKSKSGAKRIKVAARVQKFSQMAKNVDLKGLSKGSGSEMSASGSASPRRSTMNSPRQKSTTLNEVSQKSHSEIKEPSTGKRRRVQSPRKAEDANSNSRNAKSYKKGKSGQKSKKGKKRGKRRNLASKLDPSNPYSFRDVPKERHSLINLKKVADSPRNQNLNIPEILEEDSITESSNNPNDGDSDAEGPSYNSGRANKVLRFKSVLRTLPMLTHQSTSTEDLFPDFINSLVASVRSILMAGGLKWLETENPKINQNRILSGFEHLLSLVQTTLDEENDEDQIMKLTVSISGLKIEQYPVFKSARKSSKKLKKSRSRAKMGGGSSLRASRKRSSVFGASQLLTPGAGPRTKKRLRKGKSGPLAFKLEGGDSSSAKKQLQNLKNTTVKHQSSSTVNLEFLANQGVTTAIQATSMDNLDQIEPAGVTENTLPAEKSVERVETGTEAIPLNDPILKEKDDSQADLDSRTMNLTDKELSFLKNMRRFSLMDDIMNATRNGTKNPWVEISRLQDAKSSEIDFRGQNGRKNAMSAIQNTSGKQILRKKQFNISDTKFYKRKKSRPFIDAEVRYGAGTGYNLSSGTPSKGLRSPTTLVGAEEAGETNLESIQERMRAGGDSEVGVGGVGGGRKTRTAQYNRRGWVVDGEGDVVLEEGYRTQTKFGKQDQFAAGILIGKGYGKYLIDRADKDLNQLFSSGRVVVNDRVRGLVAGNASGKKRILNKSGDVLARGSTLNRIKSKQELKKTKTLTQGKTYDRLHHKKNALKALSQAMDQQNQETNQNAQKSDGVYHNVNYNSKERKDNKNAKSGTKRGRRDDQEGSHQNQKSLKDLFIESKKLGYITDKRVNIVEQSADDTLKFVEELHTQIFQARLRRASQTRMAPPRTVRGKKLHIPGALQPISKKELLRRVTDFKLSHLHCGSISRHLIRFYERIGVFRHLEEVRDDIKLKNVDLKVANVGVDFVKNQDLRAKEVTRVKYF